MADERSGEDIDREQSADSDEEGLRTEEENDSGELDPDPVPESAGDGTGDGPTATAADVAGRGETDWAPEWENTGVVNGPGARLREARQECGLELDDLARTLNLPRRVVGALEDDDYDRLPAPTFVRGYIRACARELDLDAQPLLDDYEDRAGRVTPSVQPTPHLESAAGSIVVHRRPGMVMAGVGLAIIASALVALFSFWPDAVGRAERAADSRSVPAQQVGSPTEGEAAAEDTRGALTQSEVRQGGPDASPAAAGSGADAPATNPTLSQTRQLTDRAGTPAPVAGQGAEQGEDVVPDRVAPDATQPAGDEGQAGGEQGIRPDPVREDVVRDVSADGNAVRVFAGGEDHLHLDFSDECWVEVRDATDEPVYQDLNRSGQTLDLWGRAPFRVRLGYAPAVELAYNDSRVPLAPHTRNDVASLVIGR